MNDFWDVGQFKETRSGKKFFVKLGSAKPKDDGGFFINLDALPLQNSAGECSIVIQPPRERGAGGNFGGPSQAENRGPRRDPPGTGKGFVDDTEIPF